ncbi:MAG: hypothetical protein JWO57_3925, partial [Pseudonocardiales bacterium]|nr:hypothetical protein [Pseudonocardiales bacterium]
CVPVVVDNLSAQVLLSYAAGRVPAGYVEDVVAASDPRAAGIDAAARLALEMIAIPGVDGVNLSGGTSGAGAAALATALARVSTVLRDGAPSGTVLRDGAPRPMPVLAVPA